MPPVSPKEWKIGRGLNRIQSGSMSINSAAWATLAMRFSWVRTTALGAPKLPEVKRITPMSDGLEAGAKRRGRAPAAAAKSLSAKPTFSRTSSR